jgi:hypothetical protein
MTGATNKAEPVRKNQEANKMDATDEQVEILEAAHKAEAKRRGATFTFYCRSETIDCTRIFSETDRGDFWTGINPYTGEVHHLWYPCSEVEMHRWRDLIQPRIH